MSQVIIFFGSQGSGKGTQSAMCASFLEKQNDTVIHISTGEGFREFSAEEGVVEEKVKNALDNGEMLPVFFPIWLWTKTLLENNYSGNESLIFDGSPRTIDELEVFNAALDFYGWKPVVINLALSEEEVLARIKARGRDDDNFAGVLRRLSWYKEQTMPVLEEMRKDDRYAVYDLDGAGTVEEIHEKIKQIIQ